jgi:A/G-specific adenine glycosylase
MASTPEIVEFQGALEGSGFTRALLRWAAKSRRDLPWRATRDPWAVLVSEVMLQQTQVSRVEVKYLEFLEYWPTPEDLAHAELSELLKFWIGLGYPRRARNLRQAAQQITKLHQGRVPQELGQLLQLPGVGPYTARAVMVFAFGKQLGVVDTNVGRLLARWCGSSLRSKTAQELADKIVAPGQSWDWNQGLFDLAATVCTKRNPQCRRCPVKSWCAWQGAGKDPAQGSAGVSKRQQPFQGSDRQARGRLLSALAQGSMEMSDAAAAMGLPDEQCRVSQLVNDLRNEGLVASQDDVLLLGDLVN